MENTYIYMYTYIFIHIDIYITSCPKGHHKVGWPLTIVVDSYHRLFLLLWFLRGFFSMVLFNCVFCHQPWMKWMKRERIKHFINYALWANGRRCREDVTRSNGYPRCGHDTLDCSSLVKKDKWLKSYKKMCVQGTWRRRVICNYDSGHQNISPEITRQTRKRVLVFRSQTDLDLDPSKLFLSTKSFKCSGLFFFWRKHTIRFV